MYSGPPVNHDHIQKAMEDIKRDRLDYYLDLETGAVEHLPLSLLEECVDILYRSPPDDNDRDIEFDSNVIIESELPERIEASLEFPIRLLEDSFRYIRIPELPSGKSFRLMVNFAGTVQDPSLKEKLLNSLEGQGSFRRFKDVLLSDKKERKKWHRYNANEIKKLIDEWLERLN